MDDHYLDEDDEEGVVTSRDPLINQNVEALLRPAAQAARSIYEREQRTDVVSGLVITLTNRAMKATAQMGKLRGYNQKLQEELKRQLEVQSRFADAVAWYERVTQIVVGGTLSKDRYDDGPHATGIRCERCHRQIEEAQIIEHLLKHKMDDDREIEIKQAADRIRYEQTLKADRVEANADLGKPKRKRTPRKKKTTTA